MVQGANQYDLYQALHSGFDAVFWVSHEAAPASSSSTLTSAPLLVDQSGADVKAALTDIAPSVAWVSIVACNSNQVVRWLFQQQSAGILPTQLHGFDGEVDAEQALLESIAIAQATFHIMQASLPPSLVAAPRATQYLVTIKRHLSNAEGITSKAFPAVTIEAANRAVGTMDAMTLAANQTSDQFAVVDMFPSVTEVKIQSGFDPLSAPPDLSLGDFSIDDQWRTLSKPDGSPLGTTERILLLDAGDRNEGV